MGVVGDDGGMQRIGAIAMRVPVAGIEDLDTGVSLVIAPDGRCQPGPFRLHRLHPGALAFAAGMRPVMSSLPHEPGEEHQGSQEAANATANPA